MLSYIWLPFLSAIFIGIMIYSFNNETRFAKILRIIFFSGVMIFSLVVLGIIGHEIWMGH